MELEKIRRREQRRKAFSGTRNEEKQSQSCRPAPGEVTLCCPAGVDPDGGASGERLGLDAHLTTGKIGQGKVQELCLLPAPSGKSKPFSCSVQGAESKLLSSTHKETSVKKLK